MEGVHMHNMNLVRMLDFQQKGDERGQLVVAEGGGKVCSVTGFSGPAWKDGAEAGRGVPGKQYISHDHNLRNGHTDQGAAGGTMGVRDPG